MAGKDNKSSRSFKSIYKKMTNAALSIAGPYLTEQAPSESRSKYVETASRMYAISISSVRLRNISYHAAMMERIMVEPAQIDIQESQALMDALNAPISPTKGFDLPLRR